MITPKMKRWIRQKISGERPMVWIGKQGATPQIINEILRQLDEKEVVKVKILGAL